MHTEQTRRHAALSWPTIARAPDLASHRRRLKGPGNDQGVDRVLATCRIDCGNDLETVGSSDGGATHGNTEHSYTTRRPAALERGRDLESLERSCQIEQGHPRYAVMTM